MVCPRLAMVLGFSWSYRWVAMLAVIVTGKVVTAKVGTETGHSFRQRVRQRVDASGVQ